MTSKRERLLEKRLAAYMASQAFCVNTGTPYGERLKEAYEQIRKEFGKPKGAKRGK